MLSGGKVRDQQIVNAICQPGETLAGWLVAGTLLRTELWRTELWDTHKALGLSANLPIDRQSSISKYSMLKIFFIEQQFRRQR